MAFGIDSMFGSGGTELHAVRLAEQLVGTFIEPSVLTLNGNGEMLARYDRAGIPVHVFPIDSLVGRSAYQQSRAMAAFLRRARIDVVHAHDSYTNFIATIAGRLAGSPLVIASKRWMVNLRSRHLWTNRIAYRAAHLVITNSQSVALSAQRDEWVPERKIRVLSNFLDNDSFILPSASDREQARKSLSYEHEDVVFATLGQLRPEKDHDLLLRAFQRVILRVPKARLLIIGDGPLRTTIEHTVASLGISKSVRLTGHSANPRSILAAADAITLSSRHEGMPNALLEGMALGLPAVATAAGGVVDVVSTAESGLLSPVDDEGALALNLERLALDGIMRRRLGSGARTAMQLNFSAGAAVHRLEQLYRSHLNPASL